MDTGKLNVLSTLSADIAKNETNIVLNAFRIAINGSLTQFNMVDGIVDEYEDESGRNILSASVDISAQPAGTSMIYKLETLNNKDLKIHGTGLSWD